MSAPHPKVQDNIHPLHWFGRKPVPDTPKQAVDRLFSAIRDMPEPESEVMPSPWPRSAEKQNSEVADAPGANRLDPTNEIAVLMRTLTWREMMDLSEAWNTPAKTLHEWAVKQ